MTVAANFGPEDIPTWARKSVSPRLRSTRLADSGMVQFMPPVRRRLPRISATIKTPARPDGELADAGQRNLDRAEQEAERHAQADGDVAELRGALDRVAEEFAQCREVVPMGEHADAVAELEQQVGARQDVGVAAADLGDHHALSPGSVEIAHRPAHDAGRDANTRM